MHYERWSRHGDPMANAATRYDGQPCAFDGCDRIAVARDHCAAHYGQLINGQPLRQIRPAIGPIEPQVDERGYVAVYDRRFRRSIGVHRIIMEGILGRDLLPGESVHHLNGDRADNRPDNLELWAKGQPAGQRVADKLVWVKSIVDRYGPIEHLL